MGRGGRRFESGRPDLPYRTAITTALAAALVLASTAEARSACRGAHLQPTAATLSTARSATLCLLNAQRAAHGLRPLRPERRLQAAATAYSRLMVRHRFFDHTTPAGTPLERRVARSGYRRWSTVAENIGWGAGSLSTPATVVAAWMRSPGHRANILSPRLRQVGVGIALGAPVPVGRGLRSATYTTDFGAR